MRQLSHRVQDIRRQNGLIAACKFLVATAIGYERFDCFLYEYTVVRRSEAEFLPRLEGVSLKIVTTREQRDELIAAGFDFSNDLRESNDFLLAGAVGFYLFVGKELGATNWAAFTPAAKAAINNYPYKVDFAHGEVCGSAAWTNPKFRGKGLHTYIIYRTRVYYADHGVVRARGLVAADNGAAQKAHRKFGAEDRIIGRVRYFKIFGLRNWKETPLPAGKPVSP